MRSDDTTSYSALPPGGRRERPLLANYANYFEVGHNAYEFLIDTGQVEPQSGDIQLVGRIAISPVHAKLLAHLLNRSIEQFESQHQPIPDLTDEEIGGDLAISNPHEFERLAISARARRTDPLLASDLPRATPDSQKR